MRLILHREPFAWGICDVMCLRYYDAHAANAKSYCDFFYLIAVTDQALAHIIKLANNNNRSRFTYEKYKNQHQTQTSFAKTKKKKHVVVSHILYL